MSILVTGGAGYIGSHTCIELQNAGYDVVVMDNLSNSREEVIRRVEKITSKKIKFYKADILDKPAMRKIFTENSIDAVIHFAGFKAVGESVEIPLEYYHNNVTGTIYLCEVMKEFSCKKIVFSSSATVYKVGEQTLLVEGMPTGPISPYGFTKAFIEQILDDISVSDKEWSVSLLRYFNPIGAHSSGTIGEDPKGIPNNLMPYISQVAVGRLPFLNVFGDDYPTVDGTGVRDYIHVVDLAKGHLKAVEWVLNNTGCDPVNLGTGIGVSVFELIHAFEKASGIKIKYEIIGRRAGDPAEYFADVNKAKKVLNWQAEKNIDQMCEDSYRWQKNNPNGYGD